MDNCDLATGFRRLQPQTRDPARNALRGKTRNLPHDEAAIRAHADDACR